MIRSASSLTNRIFLASTLLATLSLGAVFYVVNAAVSAQAEADLRRDLADAATLVEQHRATLTETFTRLARVIADLPKLKAAVETGDPSTIQPIADEYRGVINPDVFVVTDPRGVALASSGVDIAALPETHSGVAAADEVSAFLPHSRGLLQVVSVPIFLGRQPPEILGRLTVGFLLDDKLAMQFKGVTGAEIAFTAGGRVLAASLPDASRSALAHIDGTQQTATIILDDEEYLALARPIQPGAAAGPATLILRSRTERLRFLTTLRAGLVGALVVTILLATILSYGVARTMTRPLSAVTNAMRDVAATGDLTRKVTVRSRAWDDEDARLLASAFNTLTDSIAQFQREAAQKEKLSSLGRLSTVVAHEIRNPLMIIRASLATLRSNASAAERREAVADIDEETTRLNRIVTEVLDFAKPIRFDLGEACLNDICRASSAAAWAGSANPAVRLDLDPTLPTVVTDAERLRTALVNILSNARHAVEAAHGSGGAPPVEVSTRHRNDTIVVSVRDRGTGIAPEDMARIFDPYFTTRRAGTGLGLPITKNIIEGLGGTVVVNSRRGEGTEIRIEFPAGQRGGSRRRERPGAGGRARDDDRVAREAV